MLGGLRTLFSTETFMARGHSYLWTPSLLVMELVTNALIALAAVAIAVALLRAAAHARPSAGKNKTFGYVLLALLALGLAAAHALDVWVIWKPLYGVDVVVRCATAVVAVAAAIVVPRMLRRG